MNTLLLLLLDSRAPAGAHNHSAGMEAAVGTGLVSGLADVEDFCRARLATSARVAAAFAAAACRLEDQYPERCTTGHAVSEDTGAGYEGRASERCTTGQPVSASARAAEPCATKQPAGRPGGARDQSRPDSERATRAAEQGVCGRSRSGEWSLPDAGGVPGRQAAAGRPCEDWALLDAELDARIPSEAARAASRQLGSGLRRLLRSVLPGADLDSAWVLCGTPPHHPLVLGAGVALAGGTPLLAARAAALAACAGPASAAVRLLSLDPFAVQAMLARLAPGIDACAESAALASAGPPHSLAAAGPPALDLLADVHLTAEVRLFAS